jgi:ribosomal subunit interface protein
MIQAIQITSRGIALSDSLRTRIEEKALKLDQFFERITACHVTLAVENPRRHQGRRYKLTIDLKVPNKEIVVNRGAYEDLNAAIREGFDAAGRQLEDHVRLMRGRVKRHEEPPEARVVDLDIEKGFGFLETRDGRQIYFHRNSVLHDAFRRMRVGTRVHFAEELGDKGAQASTVTVLPVRAD